MTRTNAPLRTGHARLLGLPGEPWAPGNLLAPQPCATDTPFQSQNGHASLKAALDWSTVAISEDQAQTVCIGTPFLRHTPGCPAAAWLAQACCLHPVRINKLLAAVQPLWMFHWPIFPRVYLAEQHVTFLPLSAAVFHRARRSHCTLWKGSLPARPRASNESTELWLSSLVSPQLWYTHQRGAGDGAANVHWITRCTTMSEQQQDNVRSSKNSLNRPISQRTRALCQLNY